jgi:transglutaminase superfamily protein
MHKLRRFFDLPWRFKLLLIAVLLRLFAVSLLLCLTPSAAVYRVWLRDRQVRRIGAALSVDEICRAVTMIGRYVPGASCLVQAVVTRDMLRRAGHSAEVRIGVLKGAGILKAHAWVECCGEIVIGGTVDRYFVFPQVGS